MKHTWFKTCNALRSLLVGVIVWDLCPVVSELFEVLKQRADLFLDVSLRNEDETFGSFVFRHDEHKNITQAEVGRVKNKMQSQNEI